MCVRIVAVMYGKQALPLVALKVVYKESHARVYNGLSPYPSPIGR